MRAARILILIMLVCFGACSSSTPSDRFLNKPLPTTNFYTVDGDLVSSDTLKGKVSVVAFWAQWCPSSRSRIPGYNELAGDSRFADRVAFYGVGLDKEQDYQKYMDFIRTQKLNNFKHFFSGNGGADQSLAAWRVDRLPQFFVINTQGILALSTHSVGDVEDLLEEQLLEEK